MDYRGYRNGHLPERTISVGMGAVEVRVPRVSDVPPAVSADGFHSEIVSTYQGRTDRYDALCPQVTHGMRMGRVSRRADHERGSGLCQLVISPMYLHVLSA
jgi:hypothetical protein